jgi:gamma-glutamylputrescine oxidase
MISVWEKESFFAPQDVIIAGSGFTGLWSALFIKKKHPSTRITILDRGFIPAGASSRNAGFACFGSLSELISDGKNYGTDKMLELVGKRFRGLQTISEFFKPSSIDFELCGGYELYGDEIPGKKQLVDDMDYMNRLLKTITGKKKTFSLVDEKISKFGFGDTGHLVKNNFEGYLHSGKLLQKLLQKVQSMGVQVLNNFEIKNFSHKGNGLELATNHDITLFTRQLLVCSNAFARDLVPDIDIVPARGQVLLTSPIADLPWKGSFHSEEGYYYFRNLGKKVLLGGARHKAFEAERTQEMTVSEFIQQQLENYLSRVILPGRKDYKIEQRWSGIMAMGSEKLPIIKKVEPQVFCAVRMSGMGVALAPIVAQQVAKMMDKA